MKKILTLTLTIGLLLIPLMGCASEPPTLPLIQKQVQLPGGLTLDYREQGHPQGPVFILLHGYTDSWFSYSRVLPLLSPKYHVFAVSQRAHGDSAAASDYSMQAFADDVIAFM